MIVNSMRQKFTALLYFLVAVLVFNTIFLSFAQDAEDEVTFADCTTIIGLSSDECNGLVAIYNSMDGTNWIQQDGWLITNTPCDWYGVECESNTIVRLILQVDLGGELPPEIGNFTNLREIDCSEPLNLDTGLNEVNCVHKGVYHEQKKASDVQCGV